MLLLVVGEVRGRTIEEGRSYCLAFVHYHHYCCGLQSYFVVVEFVVVVGLHMVVGR